MSLPTPLIHQIRKGQVVLVLGAGASYGARCTDGSSPPDANQLRNRIVERFLSAADVQHPLMWAVELAISETDSATVQGFIAEHFEGIEPAPYHELIPTFNWRGIATTNYDRIIETIYQSATAPIQSIVPFLSNLDRVDENVRRQDLILIKLHGCISRVADPALPLILTSEQYTNHRHNRTRLFNMLEEWGSENTIVFIGHRLQDPDLRVLIGSITNNVTSRPRYYIVRPNVARQEKNLWESRRIEVLDSTFEDFLNDADSAIDRRFRQLATRLPTGHAIQTRFIRRSTLSATLAEFLTETVEYVHEGMAYESGDPRRFYMGFGQGWYAILQNLDVRRELVDQFLEDVILLLEEDRASLVEFYVIKAEAGAGKSVLLNRIAWEAATGAGALCLRVAGTPDEYLEGFAELFRATGERIFLFVDNAADRSRGIHAAIRYAKDASIKLTVISAERVNEWNMSCDELDEHVTESFQLGYLRRVEIGELVDLLEKNDALGPNLENKTRDERIEEFYKRARRQLLVALHEATHGVPFEEILLDEYHNLATPDAQKLYLSVCVLNRFGVPVRAGVISRVHSIPFDDFRERLFEPLEHVVLTTELSTGDKAYSARHPEIAQIVFDRVLTDAPTRRAECIHLIRFLNPLYTVDYEALRGLTRARTLHRLFPEDSDVQAIYTEAEYTLGKDPYLLQQRANWERLRPTGDLRLAQSLLDDAMSCDPHDESLVHTYAEVLRSRAEASDRHVERTRYRRQARAALRRIRRESRYTTVTELKITIDELRDRLSLIGTASSSVDGAIRDAEHVFQAAKQSYPSDSYVLSTEADLARLFQDDARVLDVLRSAQTANPQDPFIVSRLSSILALRGDSEEAGSYLKKALESNYGDQRLNFLYGEFLRNQGSVSPEELVYYYQRSFTNGDANYESQFWYARFCFECSDSTTRQKSRGIFERLRSVPMPYEKRVKIRDAIGGMDTATRFNGVIARVEAAHGFVIRDGLSDWVYFHRDDVDMELWRGLGASDGISFSIGFNLRGPKAIGMNRVGVRRTVAGSGRSSDRARSLPFDGRNQLTVC